MSINNVLKFHAIWRWSPGKVLVIWPISNGMTLYQNADIGYAKERTLRTSQTTSHTKICEQCDLSLVAYADDKPTERTCGGADESAGSGSV